MSKIPPAKQLAIQALSLADISIGGNRPWDVQIYNDDVYSRVLKDGSLGLGEAYMDGWWGCHQLDCYIEKLCRARLYEQIKQNKRFILQLMIQRLWNLQSYRRSLNAIERHYDIGNDLYQAMLDPTMNYSCAYWKDADTLAEAQRNKMDLIARKLGLQAGMRVLDVGCGFGGMARAAAEHYQCEVVGINISKKQIELARKTCQGLDVDIRAMDYRELLHAPKRFDRIVSIGMFEHIGYKNYKRFMRIMHQCLEDDGLMLIQTVGSHFPASGGDPWVDKYIFPDAMLPTMKQISTAGEAFFVFEDWHNFGPDYDKTLMAWYDNCVNQWPTLSPVYDQRLYRMWEYYLLSFAGAFRARDLQLWQIVLSKHGISGGYDSIR